MRLIICSFFIVLLGSVNAQLVHPANTSAFLQDEVAEVRITINPQALNSILVDSVDANYEYPATFVYHSSVWNDSITNVGFRLRGNTSRHAAKKSFKIDFNVYQPGFKWMNLKCMNLNGEHNDVSIMRSRTCNELLREAGLPCSRTSYIKLFINNEYRGLYINVEHIDDQCLEARFLNNDTGDLYKCAWGSNLTYLGANANNYSTYELKTNTALNDKSALINFINVLNYTSNTEFPCAIQEVLDVDSYLNTLALEILMGQWDGYAFNKNNYYLYRRPSDGKFVFIEYDLDNTFGVDWFNINWSMRNIYAWQNSTEPRPLYTRLMAVPYFKDRFSFYMEQHLANFFNINYLSPLWESTQLLIQDAALADDYKGYDYGFTDQDFLDAIQSPWGSHLPTSLSSYAINRYNSANNQLVYNQLINPCSVGISEMESKSPFPTAAFDLMGREIPIETKNSPILLLFSDGSTQFIFHQD